MKDRLLAVDDMHLERGGRLEMLSSLARISAKGESTVRISMVSLATSSRTTVGNGHRILKSFQADELQLVRTIGQMRLGPNATGLYEARWDVILPIAEAVRIARRRIFAGAAREIAAQSLMGKQLTKRNGLRVIQAVQTACRREKQTRAVYLLEKQRKLFLEAVSIGFDDLHEPSQTKSDELPSSPIGKTSTYQQECSLTIGDVEVCCETNFGAPIGQNKPAWLCPSGIAGAAPHGREKRRNLRKDLEGTRINVSDTTLIISTSFRQHADRIRNLWFDSLLVVAKSHGLMKVRVGVTV